MAEMQTNIKMINLNPNILKNTLNKNELKTPIRQRLSDQTFLKSKIHLYSICKKYLNIQTQIVKKKKKNFKELGKDDHINTKLYQTQTK